MKVIAFYLPQFHSIPENDKWWGKGFTEWTNTKKAKPLFEGHYQPHTPLNNNYYDLTNKDTLLWQIDLAKKYGVYGFCFYHYWFKNGKKLLEKPVEMFLNNTNMDISFCLSWANENWTRVWDGGDKEIIMEQEYGSADEWIKHYEYLKKYFCDKRYIYVDDKPLLIIYRPELIKGLPQMLSYWRELAKKDGFKDLYIVAQGTSYCRAISEKQRDTNINGYIMYEPGYTYQALSLSCVGILKFLKNILVYKKFFVDSLLKKIFIKFHKCFNLIPRRPLNLCKYSILSDAILKNHPYGDYYPGYFTGWDNTARRGIMARIVTDSSPQLFRVYLTKILEKFKNKKDFLFITAWNEWAEGAHLEPDEKYGYGYLEALRDALIETGEFPSND